jgi:hypothetical protein
MHRLMTTSNAFDSTFAVFPNTQSQAKNCKRATKPTHPNRHELTTKQTTEKEGRRHNSVLPQLAVTCKIEAECSYQTFVQVDSEVLRNRQLRQHANRYV